MTGYVQFLSIFENGLFVANNGISNAFWNSGAVGGGVQPIQIPNPVPVTGLNPSTEGSQIAFTPNRYALLKDRDQFPRHTN